jgi:hypothetical protein
MRQASTQHIHLRTHSKRVEIQANKPERDLIALEDDLSRMGHLTDEINSSELRREILYSMSLIEGLLGALEIMREWAQLQIDLVSRGQWTLPQTSNQEWLIAI